MRPIMLMIVPMPLFCRLLLFGYWFSSPPGLFKNILYLSFGIRGLVYIFSCLVIPFDYISKKLIHLSLLSLLHIVFCDSVLQLFFTWNKTGKKLGCQDTKSSAVAKSIFLFFFCMHPSCGQMDDLWGKAYLFYKFVPDTTALQIWIYNSFWSYSSHFCCPIK